MKIISFFPTGKSQTHKISLEQLVKTHLECATARQQLLAELPERCGGRVAAHRERVGLQRARRRLPKRRLDDIGLVERVLWHRNDACARR